MISSTPRWKYDHHIFMTTSPGSIHIITFLNYYDKKEYSLSVGEQGSNQTNPCLSGRLPFAIQDPVWRRTDLVSVIFWVSTSQRALTCAPGLDEAHLETSDRQPSPLVRRGGGIQTTQGCFCQVCHCPQLAFSTKTPHCALQQASVLLSWYVLSHGTDKNSTRQSSNNILKDYLGWLGLEYMISIISFLLF